MSMSKESTPSFHHGARLATEIGASAIGVGLSAVTAHELWRRHQKGLRNFDPDPKHEDFQQKAAIFEEPRLSDVHRSLLNKIAARVYFAAQTASAGMITRDELFTEFEPSASRTAINRMIGHLTDRDLISRFTDDGKELGAYRATDVLDLAVREGDHPNLSDAILELTERLH